MRFHTVIEAAGKTATGIEIPPEVVESLGAGRKPPILKALAMLRERRKP
jgi:hypothetical protein